MQGVKETKEREFIKKSLKYREFQPPVIHLEFLPNTEFDTAMMVIGAFECAGIPFATVTKNAINKQQLDVSTYGLMTNKERKQIYNEVLAMQESGDFTITLD